MISLPPEQAYFQHAAATSGIDSIGMCSATAIIVITSKRVSDAKSSGKSPGTRRHDPKEYASGRWESIPWQWWACPSINRRNVPSPAPISKRFEVPFGMSGSTFVKRTYSKISSNSFLGYLGCPGGAFRAFRKRAKVFCMDRWLSFGFVDFYECRECAKKTGTHRQKC